MKNFEKCQMYMNYIVFKLRDKRGIGTIELIFITVIVLGIAIVFRDQIVDVFNVIKNKLEALKSGLGKSMEVQ